MFRSNVTQVVSCLDDGDEVVVTGSADVYPKSGSYQIYAARIMPVGRGAQIKAKEILRAALEREGLFDTRAKRPIPEYPAKVVVITSPTGAAIEDVLSVSEKRAPYVDITIIPTLVQGVDAPEQVADALAIAGKITDADCVILARGGGAKDDLSPFDDERIVRAIRMCALPVVTGIGHEIDSSLADLAADIYAPTPSAAAERVFPDINSTISSLSGMGRFFVSQTHNAYGVSSAELTALDNRLSRLMAENFDDADFLLTLSFQKMSRKINDSIAYAESLLSALAASCDALSPLAVLGRGYAICTTSDGSVVKSARMLKTGDKVNIRFGEGEAGAVVENIKENRG
jgi:exodeoxyribonuclease VII large subunit